MNPHAYLTDPEQIKTVESIKRVDDRGYLYHMDCSYNYYEIPDQFRALIDAGCAAFVTKSIEGDMLFVRNYDFPHHLNNQIKNPLTGINVIVDAKNPAAKYQTLGVSDAYWIDFQNGSLAAGAADDGTTDLSAFILCPYICMDGVNEKGLAVSILALPVECSWDEIGFDEYPAKLNENKTNFFFDNPGEEPSAYQYRAKHGSVAVNNADKKAWIASQRWVETKAPGKKTVLHPILMRMMLDNCANVNEAVAMAEMFNVKGAMPGADYHLFIGDSDGNSRIIEWIDDKIAVTDTNHATNHYVAKKDMFTEKCPRDEIIKGALLRTEKAGMMESFIVSLLGLIIQDPANKVDFSKTQYSCIYNLTKKTLKIFSFGDLTRSWDYSL